MVLRGIAVVSLLAGCDRLFGLAHVDPPPRDALAGDVLADTGTDSIRDCPITYEIQLAGYSSRYRVETASTSWDLAEITCEGETAGRTHLMVMDDDDERLRLVAELVGRGMTSSVWIGYSDRNVEGEFQWVTAQAAPAPASGSPPWGAGQPDDQMGTQDCVRIQGASSGDPTFYDDGECTSIFDFVCECDGLAPVPEHY